MDEESKIDYKTIWNAVILISIGIIFVTGYMILNEYYGAKNSCEETGGKFRQAFGSYSCNNKPFIRYSDAWDYEREINISEVIFP